MKLMLGAAAAVAGVAAVYVATRPRAIKGLKLKDEELGALLSGKNILFVGGTAGIGKAIAVSALRRGANVTVVGRRKPDGELSGAKFIQKDLTLMRDAQTVIDDLGPAAVNALDVIVFTNGILAPAKRTDTAEGIEIDLAVSFLSRLAMINRYASVRRAAAGKTGGPRPRVFIMGYPGENMQIDFEKDNLNSTAQLPYGQIRAHLKTVVANEALVHYAAEILPGHNVYGLNPALVGTEGMVQGRSLVVGKGVLGNLLESFIKFAYPDAESLSENVMVHVLASPALDHMNLKMIGASGEELSGNKFLAKPGVWRKVIDDASDLLKQALSVKI